MNTQDIYNFIAVAEAGSMSQAAQRLFMTPQGLSKSIKGLEAELGVVLLMRSSKGVELTKNGEIFLKYSKEVYKSLYHLEHIFDGEIDSLNGKIKISSAMGILSTLTPEYLLSFNGIYPNVEISIKEKTDRFVDMDVASGEADMGLTKLPVDTKTFNVYPINTNRHCAMIYEGHRLYGRETISVKDLKDEIIIIENSDFKVYSKFVQLCEEAGFEPEIYFETTEISMAHYLAHLKKGIAITVETERERIAHSDLSMAFFEEPFMCEWAIITKKSVTPIAKEMLKYLGQIVK
ncbi:MAG: LysR family transcriptional regulator [Eubacteriales bacterium]|nr:LysR family transcriptional regulator [Eubacteriales bacterium]